MVANARARGGVELRLGQQPEMPADRKGYIGEAQPDELALPRASAMPFRRQQRARGEIAASQAGST